MDGSLIVFTENEGLYIHRSDVFIEHFGFNPMAFGCGGKYAQGALDAGATAYRAAEIAINRDEGCGIGINEFNFANFKELE